LHTKLDSILISPYHYVDIEVDSTLSLKPVVENIPNDTYTKLTFTFGLDTAINTPYYFTTYPELNMSWPSQLGGGYHYMKFEGKYLDNGDNQNFNIHTGASMGNPYHIYINVPESGFEVKSGEIEVTMAMNINNWQAGPNTYDLKNYSAGIMMDTAAQDIIKHNAFDVFAIKSIEQ
jgi:hypothetical protein